MCCPQQQSVYFFWDPGWFSPQDYYRRTNLACPTFSFLSLHVISHGMHHHCDTTHHGTNIHDVKPKMPWLDSITLFGLSTSKTMRDTNFLLEGIYPQVFCDSNGEQTNTQYSTGGTLADPREVSCYLHLVQNR